MIVIGGGAAGAAAAFRLQRLGHEVVLLEADPQLGGRTRTVDRGGFGVEVGAIYMLNSYERSLALLEEAGRSDLMTDWSPLAGLWDGRQLHELRYDYLPSFFKLPLLTLSDKVRLAVGALRVVLSPAPEPFETDSLARFDKGEDMEHWARRRLGDNLFECFVRPLIEPSFGVDCRDLSVPYLQGIMKRAHRAKFQLPVQGMGSICEALTRDVTVRLETRAEAVARDGDEYVVLTSAGEEIRGTGLVVATDARTAAHLLESVLTEEKLRSLREAPYAAMAHAVLTWDEDPWPDHLVEMLLPVGSGPRPILGTIVKTSRTSALVPSRGRLMNAYFSSDATRAMSDEEMIATALAHVADIYGAGAPQPKAEVIRFDIALASSPPGHYGRMQQLRQGLPAGLALAGDYLAHLGVETAVVSGVRAALSLARA